MANKTFSLEVLFKMVNRVSSPLKKIGGDTGGLRLRIKRLGGAFQTMSTKAQTSMKRMQTSMRATKTALGNMPLIGKFGLAAAGGFILKSSIDFNKGMANVATLIPGNIKRVRELKEETKRLAIDVGKPLDDMAGGLYNVVSAFGDNEETMGRLQVVSRSAVAGVASTTEALELLSSVTKNYGDTSVKGMQKASDLAFKTVELGQTTFADLAGAMQVVATDTQALGVSQEELFATMATLTGVTGNASMVATQLRSTMVSLAAPTKHMQALYNKMGVESGNALIEQEGLQGAMKAIMIEAEKTGTPLKKYIGRVEGQKIAMKLAGVQSKTYEEKLKKLEKATGSTNKAFKEQTEGINKSGHAWEKFKVTLTATASELGDLVLPALTSVLEEGIMPMIKGLGELAKGDFWKGIGSNFMDMSTRIAEFMTGESLMTPEENLAGLKKQRKMAETMGGFSPGAGNRTVLSALDKQIAELSKALEKKEKAEITVNVGESGEIVVGGISKTKGAKVRLQTDTTLGGGGL